MGFGSDSKVLMCECDPLLWFKDVVYEKRDMENIAFFVFQYKHELWCTKRRNL